MTAWNPLSRRLHRAKNEARQEILRSAIMWQGYRCYTARNIPIARNIRRVWTEESLFVPDLSAHQARRLARRFGQAAFLAGCGNGPARLVFC